MINVNQIAQAGSLLSSLGNYNFTQKRDIVTVNGLQEAKDFKLEKNERVALIDSNADILYIKECDDIGKYILKVYECKDITMKFEKENTPAVISRAEFDNLLASVIEMKSLLTKENNNEYDVKKQKNESSFSDKKV